MEITIPLYPVLIFVWAVVLIWIIGTLNKYNVRFQKFMLSQLKYDWKLVQANVISADLFADRLEELEEFIISDNDAQDLIANIVKVLR